MVFLVPFLATLTILTVINRVSKAKGKDNKKITNYSVIFVLIAALVLFSKNWFNGADVVVPMVIVFVLLASNVYRLIGSYRKK
jgi:predicted Na+-dependent transporter